jgi:subtilase family serine protease
VAGACALAAAAGAAGTGVVNTAATAATTGKGAETATSALSAVVVHPDAIRVGKVRASGPTSTAQCESEWQIACYTPRQLEQAYDLPKLYAQGFTGRGTTIAIVDSFGSPTIRHDLTVFDRAFGLPAPPSFQIIAPAGKLPAWNTQGDMPGWAGETTLDVEYAHAIAPGAKILLVETPVDETEGTQGFPQIVAAEEYVLKHYHVDVISQSFSATEQSFSSEGGLAAVEGLRGANFAAEKDHVTMLAASGDSGAADVGLNGSTYYTFPVTSWSDSDPLVTGVGGTQLHLDGQGNATRPATVWNDTYSADTNIWLSGSSADDPDAGGGGKSIFFGRPSYQNGVANVVGNARGVPDVSMSGACNGAIDLYSSYPGAPAGWGQECGTSEATPEFAGIVALAAQFAGHPLGLINPALYTMSAHRAHLPGLVPVTSGNNTVTFKQNGKWYTVKGFSASPDGGYSMAAGVGTVNALYFVPELAELAGLQKAEISSGHSADGQLRDAH